jgi:hypothetical protein
MKMRSTVNRRSLLPKLALVLGSTLFALVVLEIALRTVPALWPKIAVGVGRFDPVLGLEVHGAPLIYNKVRWVVRAPNPDGFLDVAHTRTKPPGIRRVGFFGDSYVQADHVPLEDTFFRLLSDRLRGDGIEPLAFGIAGWGTVHSLMAYRVLGERYDLDLVVYVFFQNDPGDELAELQYARKGKADDEPTAVLADNDQGFSIRAGLDSEQSWTQRIGSYLEGRIMLYRAVRASLKAWRLAREANAGSGPGEPRPPTNQNDPPSTWPPKLLADGRLLTRRVLARFKEEVERDGRRFAVLYVPNGNEEIEGRLPLADRWLPWLAETCAELGIRLIDPTEALRQHQTSTRPMYVDHWSPAGHAVIADVLAGPIREMLASRGR